MGDEEIMGFAEGIGTIAVILVTAIITREPIIAAIAGITFLGFLSKGDNE